MTDKTVIVGSFEAAFEGHAANANEAMMQVVANLVGSDSDNLIGMINRFEAAGADPGYAEDGRPLTYNDVKLLAHMGFAATATVQFGLVMAIAVSHLPPHLREKGMANAYKRLEEAMEQSVAEAKLVMAEALATIDLDRRTPSNDQPI